MARRARHLRFHRMVERISRSLPDKVQASLKNVAIVVLDEPTASQRSELTRGGSDILGLYQGVPMILRGGDPLLPDRITIFVGPISRYTRSRAQMEEQIRITLLHEIGHHLGYDELGLQRIGLG